jgi:hypothetical protein
MNAFPQSLEQLSGRERGTVFGAWRRDARLELMPHPQRQAVVSLVMAVGQLGDRVAELGRGLLALRWVAYGMPG